MKTNIFTESLFNIGIIFMILGVVALFFGDEIQHPLYKMSTGLLALGGFAIRKINGKY